MSVRTEIGMDAEGNEQWQRNGETLSVHEYEYGGLIAACYVVNPEGSGVRLVKFHPNSFVADAAFAAHVLTNTGITLS